MGEVLYLQGSEKRSSRELQLSRERVSLFFQIAADRRGASRRWSGGFASRGQYEPHVTLELARDCRPIWIYPLAHFSLAASKNISTPAISTQHIR